MGERYIPALGYTWLTRLYDLVLRATMREATFKSRLLAQAELRCTTAFAHDTGAS